MIDKTRRKIAGEFRRMLDRGTLRKNAIEEIKRNHGVSRASLYAWCKRFGVKTN